MRGHVQHHEQDKKDNDARTDAAMSHQKRRLPNPGAALESDAALVSVKRSSELALMADRVDWVGRFRTSRRRRAVGVKAEDGVEGIDHPEPPR